MLIIPRQATLHHRLTSGRVKHGNLVTLNYSFETRDWLFLVLEYCEGQDLYYWLTQSNSNDTIAKLYYSSRAHLEVVKQVFEQILDAVGHCHDNGIAHRDLKPENFIVITKNGKNGVHVKLTDFGLATDEIKSIDFECGSKPYMSYGKYNSEFMMLFVTNFSILIFVICTQNVVIPFARRTTHVRLTFGHWASSS